MQPRRNPEVQRNRAGFPGGQSDLLRKEILHRLNLCRRFVGCLGKRLLAMGPGVQQTGAKRGAHHHPSYKRVIHLPVPNAFWILASISSLELMPIWAAMTVPLRST